MTRCRDVDRLATAYLEGELDDRRSSAVRGHLRVCQRCAERVEDEAHLATLAGELEPVDPPPSMWRAIDARLAEAEIGDSRRSALWLLFQRALDAGRRNPLVLGLGTTAAALLSILWLSGGKQGGPAEQPELAAAAPSRAAEGAERPADGDALSVRSDPPAGGAACAAVGTHEELLRCQMREADRGYVDAIAELGRAVAEERASWSAADAARFDSALARLGRAAEIERVRLAGQPAAAGPAIRDPLHAIYRAQIDLLTSAVVAGDLSGASSRRGGP